MNALLSQRGIESVWMKYYQNGNLNPHACPYRPWESAINMIGIITYLNERNQTT